MITYSSNLCKKSSLQCYRLDTCLFFRSSHKRCFVRKKLLLEISQNSKENTSDLSGVFSWRSLVYFIPRKKRDEKREIHWWSSNIYFFARVSICLTSKISKETWQIVIWSENVFKDRNLSREKFPGDEHLTSSSTKTA